MLSHELAKQLLSMPNLPIHNFDDDNGEVKISIVIDTSHKNYVSWNAYQVQNNISWDDSVKYKKDAEEWFAKQPKMDTIYIPIVGQQ